MTAQQQCACTLFSSACLRESLTLVAALCATAFIPLACGVRGPTANASTHLSHLTQAEVYRACAYTTSILTACQNKQSRTDLLQQVSRP